MERGGEARRWAVDGVSVTPLEGRAKRRVTELAHDLTLAEINNERGTIDVAKHARTARRQHGHARVRAIATNHAYGSSRM